MGFSKIVRNSSEDDALFVDGRVAGSVVEVSGLANAANIDDRFVVVFQQVNIACQFRGSDEPQILGEDSWDMNVPDNAAVSRNKLKSFFHQSCTFDVVGKDVLHDVVSR